MTASGDSSFQTQVCLNLVGALNLQSILPLNSWFYLAFYSAFVKSKNNKQPTAIWSLQIRAV